MTSMLEEKGAPQLFIVMGVSGTGKTSLAKKLAKIYSYHFIEADDFHSDEAKAKMQSGTPLTDMDREPWIQRLLTHLTKEYDQNHSVVLSYSGLKAHHRRRFLALPYGKNIQFLLLHGSKRIVSERMKKRKNHFMPESLLDSQMQAMEPPEAGEPITLVNIDRRPREVLDAAKRALGASD